MLKQAITLEGLEVLDAIDRKGSFAAAANILYKVPSAITYTVQKLEQDLGVALFSKQGRRSVLTDAGKVLLEQGREILEAAERLTEATRQVDRGWESSLNIAIDSVLGIEHIYPLVKEFFEIKPDIEINLYQEVLAGGWEALKESRVNIAIGMPEKPDELSGFCYAPYSQSNWVFAVHSSHPLAENTLAVTKEDIECHRAVIVRDSSLNQAKISHRLFSKHPILSVQSLQDKIAAQKAGLGVGYLPRTRIQTELDSGEMIELLVKDVETSTTHYLAWRRSEKGKAAKWFIEKLGEFGRHDI
jgi:DNA-binding transcriptional LysR family regulator